jgi:hypothetical protein
MSLCETFVSGGFFTLFHCSIPRARNPGNHHTRESLKGLFCVHFSLYQTLSTLSTLSLSLSLAIVSFQCFGVYIIIISVQFIYLGQGPLPLDAPKARCYTVSPCDAHGAQDWLDQLSLLGWRLTTRLILEPVVLARRCRRHIYTLLPTIETGFLLSPAHFTVRTLGSSKIVN